MILISNPIGRFGNRIISFIHALHLGIHLQMNIQHTMLGRIFKSNIISITDNSDNSIKYEHNFYFLNSLLKTYPSLQKEIFYTNDNLVLHKLRQFIILPKPPIIYGDNDLHIHIRSGDIFHPNLSKAAPDSLGVEYIPPPLDFYRTCIHSRKWDNIYIICEDNRNPCLDILLKEFPKIRWRRQDLVKDIELIMGAKNLVYGQGTFIPTLLLFHDNIKTIYKINCIMPVGITKNYFKTYLIHKNIKSHTYYCKDYFKQIGHFNNSAKQRNLMITYPQSQETTRHTSNAKKYYKL